MMYYKGTNSMRANKYVINSDMLDHIDDIGFRYKKSMSSAGDTIYEYNFPVYRYHEFVSLEARFLLHYEERIILVDVFDAGSHGIYAPWYYDPSGISEKLVNIINKNIAKEMKKLHITKYKKEVFKGATKE